MISPKLYSSICIIALALVNLVLCDPDANYDLREYSDRRLSQDRSLRNSRIYPNKGLQAIATRFGPNHNYDYTIDQDSLNSIQTIPRKDFEKKLLQEIVNDRMGNLMQDFNLVATSKNNQVGSKRNFQPMVTKEDKDYSFVSDWSPVYKTDGYTTTTNINQKDDTSKLQHLLRDALLSSGMNLRFVYGGNAVDVNERDGANNAEPSVQMYTESRQKRRKCKVDPNLGIKNPSYCDTDAYFGANDYNLRDVWAYPGGLRVVVYSNSRDD